MQFIQETKQRLEINCQIVSDCITGWNSTCYVIGTFLLHRCVLLTVFDRKQLLRIRKNQTDRYRILQCNNFPQCLKYSTIDYSLFAIRTLPSVAAPMVIQPSLKCQQIWPFQLNIISINLNSISGTFTDPER